MVQYKEVALDFGFKSTSESKKEVSKSKSGKYSFHKIILVSVYLINFSLWTILYLNCCLLNHLISLALQVAQLSISLQNRPRLQDHKAPQRPDHLGQIKAAANWMPVPAHLAVPVTGQKKMILATKNRK